MPEHPIRIAVDAMGGDHAPREIVAGAIEGARTQKVSVLLVGTPDLIEKELAKHDVQGLDIRVVPATDVIEMGEAATAVRKKRDASINVTARCVKNGEAQGMVAAGSTGAAMASATLYVGRIEGIDRPAIGVTLPSIAKSCMLIDAGANAECTPEMLVQFALMGHVYMHSVHGVAKPRVGLLNIGEEQGKGNSFVNAAFDLLEQDGRFHFVGNIEGRDLFNGSVDVAVCDGFTGNVALKSAEGALRMFKTNLKTEIKRSWRFQAGAWLTMPALEAAGKKVDPEEFGGALLLGVNGLCVISHGGSRAKGIKNAIRVAKEAIVADVLGKIGSEIQSEIDNQEHAHGTTQGAS